MRFRNMPVKRPLVWEGSGFTFRTPKLLYLFFVGSQTLEEQITQLPDRQRVHEADEKAGYREFDIQDGWILYGQEPIVVVECIDKETHQRIGSACILISVYDKYQDQNFNDRSKRNSISPIEKRKPKKGHVEVFQLHKQVACMWNIKYNECESAVKYHFFALQVGDKFVHDQCLFDVIILLYGCR